MQDLLSFQAALLLLNMRTSWRCIWVLADDWAALSVTTFKQLDQDTANMSNTNLQ